MRRYSIMANGYMVDLKKLSGQTNRFIVPLTFFGCFITVFICMYCFNNTQFYGDATYYWTYADSIIKDGKIDILSYPETFRGCVWPIICLFLRKTGIFLFNNEYIVYWIFVSLETAFLFSVALPAVMRIIIKNVWDLVKTELCTLIFLVFWGKFLTFPLSDFQAFFYLCVAAYLGRYLVLSCSILSVAVASVFLGGAFYISYNTRLVYLAGCSIVFVLTEISIINKKKYGIAACSIIGILVGVLLLSMPQMHINEKYTGNPTPRVLSEQLFDYNKTLESTQVLWGLQYDLYLTYEGDPQVYDSEGFFFINSTGLEILSREGITDENWSFGQWLKLLSKYPLDIFGIYLRHLVIFLTSLYGETYVTELFTSKAVTVLLSGIIWMQVFLSVWTNGNLINEKKWYMIAVFPLILGSLLQFFGAPENRFFLPVHAVGYYIGFVTVDYHKEIDVIRTEWGSMILVLFMLLSLWISETTAIFQENGRYVFLINDIPMQYTENGTILSKNRVSLPNTKGEVGVLSYDVKLDPMSEYSISFDLCCEKKDIHLFYIDFYGVDGQYDNAEQDFEYTIKNGDNSYFCERNAGDVPKGHAVVRIVYATNRDEVIRNFKVKKWELNRNPKQK